MACVLFHASQAGWSCAAINADAYSSADTGRIRDDADRSAIVSAGQKFRYGGFDALSRDFCACVQSTGVKMGDRVAVMLPNIAAFLGSVRVGAVRVNVNPLYTPRELEHQLKDSGSEPLRRRAQRPLPRRHDRIQGAEDRARC